MNKPAASGPKSKPTAVMLATNDQPQHNQLNGEEKPGYSKEGLQKWTRKPNSF